MKMLINEVREIWKNQLDLINGNRDEYDKLGLPISKSIMASFRKNIDELAGEPIEKLMIDFQHNEMSLAFHYGLKYNKFLSFEPTEDEFCLMSIDQIKQHALRAYPKVMELTHKKQKKYVKKLLLEWDKERNGIRRAKNALPDFSRVWAKNPN
ncbi:MAG: hypothetical protein GY874_05900 [Desulfobacteraceae bacterium]|nr:hypothetical protein [Desulfobacteraceae bacterium]